LKVIATAPVGEDPHEVIASDDGQSAYVSNTGIGKFHVINVINLAKPTEETVIDTGALLGPHGLAFTDGKLWFTAEGAKAVARYDTASNKIDCILGTGQNRTHMVAVAPDQLTFYTTNVDSSTVSIFENVELPPPVTPMGTTMPGAKPHKEWLQTVIPVGKGAEGFDVSPDRKELWTASAKDGKICVIDLGSKKVTAEFDANVQGANRLKITPDGKNALVSSLRSGDLTVFDVATRKEIHRINLGHGASGILIDPDGTRAFVSCTPDNYVAVVDLKDWKVTSHVNVGDRPDGLAWAKK
jgi:YVTN family beta-propeller protein